MKTRTEILDYLQKKYPTWDAEGHDYYTDTLLGILKNMPSLDNFIGLEIIIDINGYETNLQIFHYQGIPNQTHDLQVLDNFIQSETDGITYWTTIHDRMIDTFTIFMSCEY